MSGDIITTDRFLAEKAEAIRALARRSVFEIGKHLAEVREKCPHGKWLPWLDNELGMSHTQADKYIAIYRAIEGGQIATKLQFGLGVSSLALLASSSTPDDARQEVTERAEGGERLSHTLVKHIVSDHRPPKPTLVRMPPSPLDGVLDLIAATGNGCYGKDDEPVIARVVHAASKEQLQAIIGSTQFGGAWKRAATERLGAIQRAEGRTIEYVAHDVPAREVTVTGYA